jgi:hypothetical protein
MFALRQKLPFHNRSLCESDHVVENKRKRVLQTGQARLSLRWHGSEDLKWPKTFPSEFSRKLRINLINVRSHLHRPAH